MVDFASEMMGCSSKQPGRDVIRCCSVEQEKDEQEPTPTERRRQPVGQTSRGTEEDQRQTDGRRNTVQVCVDTR